MQKALLTSIKFHDNFMMGRMLCEVFSDHNHDNILRVPYPAIKNVPPGNYSMLIGASKPASDLGVTFILLDADETIVDHQFIPAYPHFASLLLAGQAMQREEPPNIPYESDEVGFGEALDVNVEAALFEYFERTRPQTDATNASLNAGSQNLKASMERWFEMDNFPTAALHLLIESDMAHHLSEEFEGLLRSPPTISEN